MAESSNNLNHANASAIDALAHKSLLRPNKHLDNAIANSKKNDLPTITVSALQGQYLVIQAQLINAKHILEVGTLGGYSTTWFASTGAHVTSIEIDPKHRDIALQNIRSAGYENQVDIVLGAALDVLPKLAEEGKKFDLVFIDADWGEQWEYFDWAVKMTRSRGCIYVDNVVREILESEAAEGVASEQTLVAKVGKDERVQATLISTVSSQKDEMFDGFLLAIVKEGHR